MLRPAGLATIVGGTVDRVDRRSLDAPHFSGNTLERITAFGSGAVTRFVLKRFVLERDWIMRLTHDSAVREVALFRAGVYERMPDDCVVPVVAAARDGESWASLMVDVSPWLAPIDRAPLTLDDLSRYLTHLAAVHAHFLNDQSLLDPALGLSSLHDFVTILSPSVVAQEIAENRTHPVLAAAAHGWTIFATVASPEAVRIVQQIQADPRPLLRALAYDSFTLVHGDYKLANLGVIPPAHAASATPCTIMLDWQDATFGPQLLDLGYFLALSSLRLPVSKEAALGLYRAALESYGCRYPSAAWERACDLGLVAGGALRVGWQLAAATQSADAASSLPAQEELRWWCDRIVRAAHWLG